MIQARRAAFKQRRDDHDAQFARQFAQRVGRRAGDRLGQSEQIVILLAAEVLRAEQLLQADDLRARPAASRIFHSVLARFSFGSIAQLV